MNQDELKKAVGQAALRYVEPNTIIGVGTGSTVNCFIDALGASGVRLKGAVSSSLASTQRLLALGIDVVEPASVEQLSVYIDGADEIDPRGCMIKGGGAALTREKIVADLAQQFVCIADQSKRVEVLGAYPLPVEVIDMASAQVARRFARLGGVARLRPGVLTDNGHPILDVRGLRIDDPAGLEHEVNQWPGVVTVGIFAKHRASVCLLGTPQGVQVISFSGA
jgi:ribose 5-phosphate isomerase A